MEGFLKCVLAPLRLSFKYVTLIPYMTVLKGFRLDTKGEPTSKIVAIKVNEHGKTSDREIRNNKLLSALKIPSSEKEVWVHRGQHYVCQMLGWSQIDTRLVYIAFDFYVQDLEEYTVKNGPLDASTRRTIAQQLVLALAFLEQKGLIWGDCKPQNILMDGKNLKISICDFGGSCLLSDRSERLLSRTANYSPYELLFESNKRSPGHDVWSLGCTLCRLNVQEQLPAVKMTGKPIPDPGPGRVIQFPVEERWDATSQAWKTVKIRTPEIFDGQYQMFRQRLNIEEDDSHRFMYRCLTKNLDRRPTATELLEDPYIDVSHDDGSTGLRRRRSFFKHSERPPPGRDYFKSRSLPRVRSQEFHGPAPADAYVPYRDRELDPDDESDSSSWTSCD
ncbi:kinase-like protein [Meredithblackwellia eburnea MCA 4105]